jgi:P22 coat protein - gene protein 5
VANSLLSPTIITREALRILHANLNFIANCNRQYDDKFANAGASPSGRIGPSLTIRMPNQYTVRTGSVLQTQDVTETSQVLTVSTQKGVDFVFSSSDLTLTIDDFSERYLKPAVSVLATSLEADALNMVLDVANYVDDNANPITYKDVALGRKILNYSLAPDDGERVGVISSTHVPSYLDAIKGLFNPQEGIARPYLTGKIGKVNNMNFYENTVIPAFQTGTAAATTGYTTNSATAQTGSTIIVQTGTTTFLKGDIITIAGVNAVDPETKSSRGYLQPFVITANSGASATTLSISPAIVATGAAQNVTNGAANTQAIVKIGGGASALYSQSVLFHPEAFAFVTADLVDVSKFGAWGARQVMDGISMRIARQYDIVNDKIPCRLDVLYGYKTLRPQLACRIIAQ